MEFALVGPHQGKNLRLGGFLFKDGVAEVPDEARDAHNLLRVFYSAHPSHMLENIDGTLQLKSTDNAPKSSLAGLLPNVDVGNAMEPSEDYAEFSKAELKVKASEMGLETSGTKEELVVRIKDALAIKDDSSK